MLAASLFAAVAVAAAPMGIEDARAAIWSDLELNAWIGNGNDAVSLDWWAGHDNEHPPTIKLSELNCSSQNTRGHCQFTLERVPDAKASAPDQAEPGAFSCAAMFALQNEDGRLAWKVEHRPPLRGRGHSQTTMQCRSANIPTRTLARTDISRFEAHVELPEGTEPLARYARYYAAPQVHSLDSLPFTTVSEALLKRGSVLRKPVVLAVFVLPGVWGEDKSGAHVVALKDLPTPVHGGCRAVNLIVDPTSARTLAAWCNVDEDAPLPPHPN